MTHLHIAASTGSRNPKPRDLSLDNDQLTLVAANYNLIDEVIRTFTGSCYLEADYRSLGAEALVRSAKLFDPKHASSASFRTYARVGIRNAVRSAAKRASDLSKREVPFDTPIGPNSKLTLLDVLQCEEEPPKPEFPSIDSLPHKQRVVIERLREGLNQTEVAQELGLSHQAVSRRRMKAIGFLRKVADKEAQTPCPLLPFVDRPPLHSGLPSQLRHISDMFPEWWREQNERGWPATSWRICGPTSCRFYLADPRPPAERNQRARDAQTLRETERRRFANLGDQTRPDFWAHRDGLRFRERAAA